MSHLPNAAEFTTSREWVDVAEAAQIYGEEVYGQSVDRATILRQIRAGNYPSACLVSGRFVILRRLEVQSFARARKAQVKAAKSFWELTGKGSEINPSNVAVRPRHCPSPASRTRR